MRTFLLLFLLTFSFDFNTGAQVKLPSLFSDNMVLQHQSEVALWRSAKPRATLTVSTSWNKKRYKTTIDDAGKWKLKVTTPAAGGPYEISISDGTTLTLRNVACGSPVRIPEFRGRRPVQHQWSSGIFFHTDDWE